MYPVSHVAMREDAPTGDMACSIREGHPGAGLVVEPDHALDDHEGVVVISVLQLLRSFA